MKTTPRYLTEFYEMMLSSRDLRRSIVDSFLNEKSIKEYSKSLIEILHSLKSIENEKHKYKLYLNDSNFIVADLTYEISELKKDILFCENGAKDLTDWHIKRHKNFQQEIERALDFLELTGKPHFITDRDGTINNYCGRYQSSIQSAYNAVWLTYFTKNKTISSTILTSAPIANPGILDVNVSPQEYFIIAGSKGREFVYNGKKYQKTIPDNQKDKLEELNQKIKLLTEQEQYKKFTLIGSGLQNKFGQITLARQDITNAISKDESLQLLDLITKMVKEIDPSGSYFRLEDTGKDLEIMLTIGNDTDTLKDFDKGDGLNFINNELQIGFEHDNCLVCGDTHSDIPMVSKLLSNNEHVFSIFVTQNTLLINDLKSKFPENKLLIVSNPDVLITALGAYSGIIKI